MPFARAALWTIEVLNWASPLALKCLVRRCMERRLWISHAIDPNRRRGNLLFMYHPTIAWHRGRTSRMTWSCIILVTLMLSFIVPLFFRHSHSPPSAGVQIAAITAFIVIGTLAAVIARHTTFASIITVGLLTVWVIGVASGGYAPASANPSPIPSGQPILSGPWFPVQWDSQGSSAPIFWSVIDSFGLWLVGSTLVAWAFEAVWVYLRRRAISTR